MLGDLGACEDPEAELAFQDAAPSFFVAAGGVGLLDGGEFQQVCFGGGVADELGVGHGRAVVLEDAPQGDEFVEGVLEGGCSGGSGCPACAFDNGFYAVGFRCVSQAPHFLHEFEAHPFLVGAGVFEAEALFAGQVPASLFRCGYLDVDGRGDVGIALRGDVPRDKVFGGAA